MAAYNPTADDLEDVDTYNPTQEDLEESESEISRTPFNGGSRVPENIDSLSQEHPYLYKLAEKLAKNPTVNSAIKSLANSPLSEAGLSAGPAFLNSFGNIINAPTETLGQGKIVPKIERGFEEPKTLSGKAGSLAGDLLGTGTAFAAIPYSKSIPGALAAGYGIGEGNIVNRTASALMGLLMPALLHGGKFVKSKVALNKQTNKIKNLELHKSSTEEGVHKAKSALANILNKELEPTTINKSNLAKSIENAAGSSESLSKQRVAESIKTAKDHNVKKYRNLYEGFNASKAGQSAVKEPLSIESLKNDYGISSSGLSNDTQKLIKSHLGEITETPASDQISSITGQPISTAKKHVTQSAPKVADYINLWKQLRAEVSQYKHSAKMADTPEAANNFRTKAKELEKLSEDIHSKAMGSLSAKNAAKYGEIQKGYMHEVVPFNEESILINATEKHPKIPDNFFKKINTSGVPELIKSLKSSHPKLVEAITNHDLKGLSKLKSEELKEVLSGDFGNFITPEAKKLLTSLHKVKGAEELLQKALSKVQSSEIGREVKSADINSILKQRPDLIKPFKNVKDKQTQLRELKRALINEGFKLKDINDKLKKYKTIGSYAKSAGLPVAAYMGFKQKKPSQIDIE